MQENWLPIPNWLGLYAVSDQGNVMSMDYRRSGLPGLIRPFVTGGGYLMVGLCPNGKNKLVHRLVMQAFVGPCAPKMQVNHKNGIKSDNRLENLEYCTGSQNVRHAHAYGLAKGRIGSKHSLATMNEEQVIEIKKMIHLGFSRKEISDTTGITREKICRIATGVSWTHVKLSDEFLQS